MWNGIIGLVGYMLFFVKGGRVQNEAIGYLMVGLFGLIGVRLAYSALCEFFNTTTILLKSNKIAFWTKPFSMNSGQIVNGADIANLSLERIEGGRQNRRKIFKHFVNIQLKNGDLIHLCKVQDMNEGIYVEKLLEDKLGLKDDPNLDRVAF